MAEGCLATDLGACLYGLKTPAVIAEFVALSAARA